MPGTTDPLGACTNRNSNLRTLLQTHSSGSSVRSLHCDPWEKQGLGRGTQVTVSDHLKRLLARFQVSFDSCFVDLNLEEQRQPGKYFFQQPVRQSGDWHSCPRRELLSHETNSQMSTSPPAGSEASDLFRCWRDTHGNTTHLLLQILDFHIDSPQPASEI